MKIAVIAPTEIPARRANTIQVMKMTHALAAMGYPVRLAAPASRSAGELSRQPEFSWDQIARHYGLKYPFEIAWLASRPQFRRYDYSWRSVRWAQSWQADLVYTRLPQAAAMSSRLGISTILELHDIPQGATGPWLFRQFLGGKGARRLVVITQALAEDLSRRFPGSGLGTLMLVAPDGVDLDRYAQIPPPFEARRSLACAGGRLSELSPDRFTAGYTGHLYAGRGGQILLELAGRLPEVLFLVAGGEPEHVQALQRQADGRGLKNLILTGFVPNADLPLYQAACEILLMPYQHKVEASSGGDISRYLSPMKLFEYLACERAIVSSDLPVLREALNPQNALLVPPDRLEAWEKAVRDLRGDPALRSRLAAQARRDALRYTWESRARLILTGLDK